MCRAAAQRCGTPRDSLLFEAPNWSPDGSSLLINGGGRLFQLGVDAGDLRRRVDLGGIAEINNDHVISPDGRTAYVSSEDGHIYAVSSRQDVHARRGA